MVIAIDYDGTFSRDPLFFKALAALMRDYGHDPVLVTARYEYGDGAEEVRFAVGGLMTIVFTSGRLKRQAVQELGMCVHCWLDDCPESVGSVPLVGGVG